MTWNEVLADKSLHDLPYKIELNEYGQIVISPSPNWIGSYKAKLMHVFVAASRKGQWISRCSIDTTIGVKVADMAWLSGAFFKQYQYETPYPVAPEICVEVISPSNSVRQIREKIDLYLAKGAKEVWTCNESGKMTFYDHTGEMKKSKLAAKFPPSL